MKDGSAREALLRQADCSASPDNFRSTHSRVYARAAENCDQDSQFNSRFDLAPRLPEILADIADIMSRRASRGKVADYIKPLANVDPAKFGIAVTLVNNMHYSAGDAEECFSIQSVSKVFSLTLALGKAGDALWKRVGRESSGNAFNSIVQLEYERGIPRNPFINSGAITVADVLLSSHQPKETIGEIVRFVRFLANDESIAIDPVVAVAEKETGFRNEALANYMKSFGNIKNAPAHVLGVYYHHCAIAMSCKQLAVAGGFLASGGVNPVTGLSVVSPERARRINSLMLTCGLYDGSGDYAFRVGLPSKSGVGGGVLAIVPGIASIAVWSPGLNAQGNSKLGVEALEILSGRVGWSIF
ncbi:glutaminase [Pseudomonas cavernicola]|uniref:Glutaminase n=1 Tax=Pseudomonas cavernicola TaxID=2320866 RepID=A0A418X992_9PSED|nr:glutaminase [Pseudomonas cavernicola]RJG09031.1 glutaminase [Pseudomonas cavernicola]